MHNAKIFLKSVTFTYISFQILTRNYYVTSYVLYTIMDVICTNCYEWKESYNIQGWIYWGVRAGAHPPSPGQGAVLFFMIKQKIIRDKMRFSNLSNNMMISEQ